MFIRFLFSGSSYYTTLVTSENGDKKKVESKLAQIKLNNLTSGTLYNVEVRIVDENKKSYQLGSPAFTYTC